jgi:aryl-alcohol dehydrogenase-like predicted oxidoreductase
MRYRILGKTGLRVSVIGAGTWQFGGEWGRDFSQAEVDAILDSAADCGINLVDTAECYGPDHLSEKLVGDYLSRHDRSRWIVATKFGHHFKSFLNRDDDFSVDGVRAQLEASLKALRVGTIDLYQFHSGSDELFQNEKLWAMLAEQKRAGKIRHLGVSILQKGSELQAREAAKLGTEALQVFYNRLDRRPEQLFFPHARENNLGIIGRVPLASGLLSGKYKQGATFPACKEPKCPPASRWRTGRWRGACETRSSPPWFAAVKIPNRSMRTPARRSWLIKFVAADVSRL